VVSDQRRSARARREVLDAKPELRLASGPAPDARRIADDKRRLLYAGMDSLSLERRAVLVMFELDETPMAEVAEALSMSRNTCYSHLRRARRDLAAAIERLRARENKHV
jgi:RNA polymerase sigma factor (sigma-70 family)